MFFKYSNIFVNDIIYIIFIEKTNRKNVEKRYVYIKKYFLIKW